MLACGKPQSSEHAFSQVRLSSPRVYPRNVPCGPVERGFVQVPRLRSVGVHSRQQEAYAKGISQDFDDLLSLIRQLSSKPLGDQTVQAARQGDQSGQRIL